MDPIVSRFFYPLRFLAYFLTYCGVFNWTLGGIPRSWTFRYPINNH